MAKSEGGQRGRGLSKPGMGTVRFISAAKYATLFHRVTDRGESRSSMLVIKFKINCTKLLFMFLRAPTPSARGVAGGGLERLAQDMRRARHYCAIKFVSQAF